MLMLLFYLDQERYACSCEHVLEIIPPVELKPIPQMPDFIVGSLIYGGKPLPVIDWGQLILGRRCPFAYHSRIILFRVDHEGRLFEFGLIAERVTKTISIERHAFKDSGVRAYESPYFGGLYTDEKGSIQFLEPSKFVNYLQGIMVGNQ